MDLLHATLPQCGNPIDTELRVPRPKLHKPGRTVLFAEDNDDLRFVMECTLKTMGYLVVACADAHLAAAAFRSRSPVDLLLTDYEMPGRTGMELARELTALCPRLPVMVLTGSILSVEILQEMKARHWTYISKPCHLSSLETTLHHLLSVENATGRQGRAASGP